MASISEKKRSTFERVKTRLAYKDFKKVRNSNIFYDSIIIFYINSLTWENRSLFSPYYVGHQNLLSHVLLRYLIVLTPFFTLRSLLSTALLFFSLLFSSFKLVFWFSISFFISFWFYRLWWRSLKSIFRNIQHLENFLSFWKEWRHLNN